jgi:hypothetical protein
LSAIEGTQALGKANIEPTSKNKIFTVLNERKCRVSLNLRINDFVTFFVLRHSGYSFLQIFLGGQWLYFSSKYTDNAHYVRQLSTTALLLAPQNSCSLVGFEPGSSVLVASAMPTAVQSGHPDIGYARNVDVL